MTVFGWDTSHYDWDRGPMDLLAARAGGIDAFLHKGSEGSSYIDPRFGDAMNRAYAMADRFPLIAAYHVLRTSSSASAERRHLLAVADGRAPWWSDYPGWFWMLDCESWGEGAPAPTLARIHDMADQLVTETGRQVLVYAPEWVYGSTLAGLRYPLVSSRYGSNPAIGYRAAYEAAGGDTSSRWSGYSDISPTILQFGSKTVIAGQGTCDALAFRGSLDQLRQILAPGSGGAAVADYGTIGPPTYGQRDAAGRPAPQERWRHDHPDIHGADIWSILWRGTGAWTAAPLDDQVFDSATAFGRWANAVAEDARLAATRPSVALTPDQLDIIAEGIAARLAVPLIDVSRQLATLLAALRALGQAAD